MGCYNWTGTFKIHRTQWIRLATHTDKVMQLINNYNDYYFFFIIVNSIAFHPTDLLVATGRYTY